MYYLISAPWVSKWLAHNFECFSDVKGVTQDGFLDSSTDRPVLPLTASPTSAPSATFLKRNQFTTTVKFVNPLQDTFLFRNQRIQ